MSKHVEAKLSEEERRLDVFYWQHLVVTSWRGPGRKSKRIGEAAIILTREARFSFW